MPRHDHGGVLSGEEHLNLLEEGFEVGSGSGQLAEHVVFVGAPEEFPSGEPLAPVVVRAHGDEVITLETCNAYTFRKKETYR